MKIKNIWIWIMTSFIGFYGCSDMNSLHDQYMQHGETIYVGQTDSVKIFPGKNRVKLTFRSYDPKAAKLTVYWDFRSNSVQFDLSADRLGEEVEVIVDQLEEKQYTFELVTSNYEGKYPSVPAFISGEVYGSKYIASLPNRKISNATVFPLANNRMDVDWATTVGTMVGVELLYRNFSDIETSLKVPNDQMNTRVADSKDGVMMYRTLHLPEINCIDTFYTDFVPINFSIIDDEKLNRLLFRRWNPSEIPYNALSSQGWDIENMWDGNYGDVNPGFSSDNGTLVPWSFTFDLGQTAMINRIKIYPRLTAAQEYVQSHPKKITIWGSATPDVTDDFATWLYLGEFNSVKPSGPGPVTPADTEYARAGEEFFTVDNTAVRYLRFHVLETWVMPNNTVQIMELDLFGFVIE